MPKPFSSVCARSFRTGFRYEVLTDDPVVRKQVDDIIFDFYGEEAPCRQEDHEPRPEQGMTFGGM